MATNFNNVINIAKIDTDLPKVEPNDLLDLWKKSILQELYCAECAYSLALENGERIEIGEEWRNHAKDYAIRMGLEEEVNALYMVLPPEVKEQKAVRLINEKELIAITQIANILRAVR